MQVSGPHIPSAGHSVTITVQNSLNTLVAARQHAAHQTVGYTTDVFKKAAYVVLHKDRACTIPRGSAYHLSHDAVIGHL